MGMLMAHRAASTESKFLSLVASIIATLGNMSESKVAEATDSVKETLQENSNWDEMKS